MQASFGFLDEVGKRSGGGLYIAGIKGLKAEARSLPRSVLSLSEWCNFLCLVS